MFHFRKNAETGRMPRGPKGMGPAHGGDGGTGVRAETMSEAADRSSVPCPPQAKAFCALFRREKCVVVRGRDPGVLIFAGKE